MVGMRVYVWEWEWEQLQKKRGGKKEKTTPKIEIKKHTVFVLYQSMNPKESHLRLFRYN